MAYTPLDKFEMALRQAKVDIGQGRGNALTNATNVAICLLEKGVLADKYEEFIFEMSDRMFHFNQVKIDTDYQSWLKANEYQLRIDTGLEVPTINGENLSFPQKR